LLLTAAIAISAALLGLPATASTASPRSQGTSAVEQAAAASTYPSYMWMDRIGTETAFTSPTFATIDGVRAIVSGSLDGEVYVVNAITGAALPGWPQAADITGTTPTAIESSPAIAYLDGPSQPPTIIVGAGSQSIEYQNGGVIAFYASGRVRFVFHTKDTFAQWKDAKNDNSVFATPAVADIQGNGEQDIVFGSYDHFIYALTPSGALVPGFPIQRADTIWSSPALVDSSHTGRDDIIMGGDSTGKENQVGAKCWGGWVTDYRYSSSARAPQLIWERCVGQTVWSSPAIGVINPGPGNPGNEPAVVVGTSFNSIYSKNPATNQIFAFYVQTGNTVPGWPVTAAGPTFGSPVIAQMYFGGPPVVISTSCAACLHGPSIVTEWLGTGRILWSTDVSSTYQILSSPSVVNVTGTGVNDVLVGANPGVVLLDGGTGKFLYNTNVSSLGPYCRVDDAPAVSPIRGSGAPASGWELAFSCTRNGNAYLYAYPLPAVPDAVEWPEWRANAARTGVPDPWGDGKTACSAPTSTTGYRLTRADGNVLTEGQLPNCGGLRSEVIATPVAGEASTSDGAGYWIALSDGRVYAYGDAQSEGDTSTSDWTGGSVPPGAPIVGIAAAAGSRTGYYLLDGEGHVYAFGAPYYGQPGTINGTAVAIVADPYGGGYWVVTSSGFAYGFGAADPNFGQAPGVARIVGAAATSDGSGGTGLWLVSSNGTIHLLGDAVSHGEPAATPATPVVGITAASNGEGYYMVTGSGVVYAFPTSLAEPAISAQSDPIVAISAP
jgi:hypothetical protein